MIAAARRVATVALALPLLTGLSSAGLVAGGAPALVASAAASAAAAVPVITPTQDRAAAPTVALTTTPSRYTLDVGADGPTWVRFTAPRDAVAFVTLTAGGGVVFRETANGLERAGTIFPVGDRPQTVVVQAGGTYVAQIVADPYSSGSSWPESGLVELALQDVTPPNDTRATATTLPAGPATSSEGWLGWALSGQGDPTCGTSEAPATMWYRFVAPAKGALSLEAIAEPGYSASVGVYRLGKKDQLQELGCYPGRNSSSSSRPVQTQVKPGEVYYVMVAAHRIPVEFTASSYNYLTTLTSTFSAKTT